MLLHTCVLDSVRKIIEVLLLLEKTIYFPANKNSNNQMGRNS